MAISDQTMGQYTPEQRNFLVMAYEKAKGTKYFFQAIITQFLQKYPDSPQVPTFRAIRDMARKQNTFFTLHNLNSKLSPGPTHSGAPRTVRTEENLEAVKVTLEGDILKDPDDPDINTCRKNYHGISKSLFNRITKDLGFIPYKI